MGSNTPKPPSPPAPPRPDSVAKKASAAVKRPQGFGSTLLTGGQQNVDNSTGIRSLLGT